MTLQGFTVALTTAERRRLFRKIRELDNAKRYQEAQEVYQLLMSETYGADHPNAA